MPARLPARPCSLSLSPSSRERRKADIDAIIASLPTVAEEAESAGDGPDAKATAGLQPVASVTKSLDSVAGGDKPMGP